MLTVRKKSRRPLLPAGLLAVVLTAAVALSGCGETTHVNAVEEEPAGLGATQAAVGAAAAAGAQNGSTAGTSSAGAQPGSTTGPSSAGAQSGSTAGTSAGGTQLGATTGASVSSPVADTSTGSIAASSNVGDTDAAETGRTLIPRATVNSPAGILALVPTGEETVEPIEAASCLGTEGDYDIHGSYTLLLLPPGDVKPQEVQRLPDLEIIAKTSDPLTFDTLSIDGHDVYLFTPRYTDCHSLEFYAYMTDNNGAYLMGFQMDDGRTPHIFQRSPVAKPFVENDRLVVKGGYAAGMDAVTLNTFRPDWSNHRFVLDSTEQVKP